MRIRAAARLAAAVLIAVPTVALAEADNRATQTDPSYQASCHRSVDCAYLQQLKRDEVTVAIYLVNGIKLQGVITAFNSDVILLKNSTTSVTQMIYVNAIGTIVPPSP